VALPQDGRRENSFGEGGGGEDAKLKFLKGGRGSTGGTVEIMAPAYGAQRRGGCRGPASLSYPSHPPSLPPGLPPSSPGRTRNATLVRYGLSSVIPLSGDCDTEDTTSGAAAARW